MLMRNDGFLTVQQAAALILRKSNFPLKSKEIAKMILNENLIAPSKAKNPIQSVSQALERNVRMDVGNEPKLEFISTADGRALRLSEINTNKDTEIQENEEENLTKLIKPYLPKDTMDKIELYQSIKKYSRTDQAVVDLIKSGLIAKLPEILETLKNDFEKI